MIVSHSSLSRERQDRSHLRLMRLFRICLLVVPLSFVLAACQADPGSTASTPSDSGSSAFFSIGSGFVDLESSPCGQTGNWNLIFHDEFNGDSLDTSK